MARCEFSSKFLINMLPWVLSTQGNTVDIQNLKDQLTSQDLDVSNLSDTDLLSFAIQANDIFNASNPDVKSSIEKKIAEIKSKIISDTFSNQAKKETIELSRVVLGKDDIVKLYGNNTRLMTMFVKSFSLNIFKSSFIDVESETIVSSDKDINKSIARYKSEGLDTIFDYLESKSIVILSDKKSLYNDDGNINSEYLKDIMDKFTNHISNDVDLQQELNLINGRVGLGLSETESDLINAYNAYNSIKYFDYLIELYDEPIKIDPSYKGVETSINSYKYRSNTSNSLISNWRTTENSDINLETSKISKKIIESMPLLNENGEHDGFSYVEFNEFNEIFKKILDPKFIKDSDLQILHGIFINPVRTFIDFFETTDIDGLNGITPLNKRVLKSIKSYIFDNNEDSKSIYKTILKESNNGKEGVINYFNDIVAQMLTTSPNNYSSYKYDYDTKSYKTISFVDNPSIRFAFLFNDNVKTHFNSRRLGLGLDTSNGGYGINSAKSLNEINIGTINASIDEDEFTNSIQFPTLDDFLSNPDYKSINGYAVLKFIEDATGIPFVSEPNLYDGLLKIRYNNNEELLAKNIYNFTKSLISDIKALNTKDISSLVSNPRFKNKIRKDKYGRYSFSPNLKEDGKNFELINAIVDTIPELHRQSATSVYKNANGDSVPAVGLPNLVKNMHSYIDILNKKSERDNIQNNPLVDNVFFNDSSLITGTTIKSEFTNSKGETVQKSKFRVNEYFISEVMFDYFNRLNDDTINDIQFLPTTYSDKSNQMLIKVSKDMEFNGNSMKDASTSDIESEFKEKQKSYYTNILNNIIADYSRIINKLGLQDKFKLVEGDFNNNITVINKLLEGNIANIKLAAKEINKEDSNFKITEETHYSKVSIKNGDKTNNVFRVNPYIEYMSLVFGVTSSSNEEYNKYRNKSISQLIGTIKSQNIKIDLQFLPELKKQAKSIGISDDYFNDTNEMLLESNGKLNPIIEKYFYLNQFLSHQFLQVSVGEPFGHPSKLRGVNAVVNKNGFLDTDYYLRDHAARLIAQYKRMVIFQATMKTYTQGLKEGVKSDYTIGCMEDIEAPFFNPAGSTDTATTTDGGGNSNPFTNYIENKSLQSSSVGQNVKSIGHDLDLRTNTASLLKWAVFSLSNHRLRQDRNSVKMLKNMTNRNWAIKLDLSKDLLGRSRDLKDVVKDDLYYFDPKRGYFKVSELQLESKELGQYKLTEYSVDKNGNVLSETPIKTIVFINSNWDLYNVFGGFRSMSKVNNTLEYSEASVNAVGEYIINTGILRTYDNASRISEETEIEYDDAEKLISPNLYNTELYNESEIIDENGNLLVMLDQNYVFQPMKHSDIDYMVNTSAIKVGASNVNSVDVQYGDSNISTFKFSSQFIGVQMDADHHADESESTESTQLISLLAANGYTTDLVRATYEAISTVVDASMQDYLTAIGRIDAMPTSLEAKETLYKSLIDIIVKTIKDGNNISGYVANAKEEFMDALNNNLKVSEIPNKIPISSSDIFNDFISNLTSIINKTVVRRKFTGMAGVMIPSHDKMMYYEFNNVTLPNGYILDGKYSAMQLEEIIYDLYQADEKLKNIIINDENIIDSFYTNFKDLFNTPINKLDLNLYDTIIDPITLQDVYIDTYEKYVKYKNGVYEELVLKTGIPTNLKSSSITFSIPIGNKANTNMNSIDSPLVARSFNYKFKNKLEKDKHKKALNTYYGLLQEGYYQLNEDEDIEFLKSLCENDENKEFIYTYIDGKINPISDKNFEGFKNSVNDVKKTDVYRNIIVKLSPNSLVNGYDECILSKIYQTKFGLENGVSIPYILDRKNDYFYKKLTNKYIEMRNDKDIENGNVDIYINSAGNISSKIVFDNGVKDKYINSLSRIDIYTETDDVTGIKYRLNSDGERMYKINDIDIYYDANTSSEVFVVTNDDTFKEIYEELRSDIEYFNFNKSSVVDILSDILEENNPSLYSKIENSKDIQLTYEQELNREILKVANKVHLSFEETLNITANRIPAQAFQSVMGMKVVGFSDTEVNEIYVAPSQLILQGSDKTL